MKKSLLVAVAFAALGHVFGQSVTFTPLSQQQFAGYQSQAAWTLFFDVQHGGNGALMTQVATNYFDTSLGAAYAASIMFSENNGTVKASYLNQNGRFGSTGNTGGTNISSSIPLSGIVIAMANPSFADSEEQESISDLYLNSYYQQTVASISGPSSFAGMLCAFDSSATSFNALFNLAQSVGGGSEEIFIFGLEAVPEPGTLALVGIGGLALIAAAARSKK